MSRPSFIELLPEWEWKELNPEPSQADLELRFHGLKRAMKRFFDAGIPIPNAWRQELKKLYEIVGDVDIEQ